MKHVMVWDGFGDVRLEEQETNATDVLDEANYRLFLRRARQWLEEQKGDAFVFRELHDHLGLLGCLGVALENVETPIVYVTQDDMALTRPIPTRLVLETMEGALAGRNPVRFVLINKRVPLRKALDDFYGKWELANTTITNPDVLKGSPNNTILVDPTSIHTTLMRTKRWSDNNHFALKQDYTDWILPRSKKLWMDSFHQGWLKQHPESWYRYGSHLLGGLTDDGKVDHLNGRDTRWCD